MYQHYHHQFVYMYVLSVLNLPCVWQWWSPTLSTQHMVNSGCSNRHNHMTVLALTHVRYTLVIKTTHKFPTIQGQWIRQKRVSSTALLSSFSPFTKMIHLSQGHIFPKMQPTTICSTRPKNRSKQSEGNEMVSAPNKGQV